MIRWRALPLWLTALAGLAAAGPARADLQAYLKKPEPAYAWKVNDKTAQAQGTVYDLELVSQTWEDITWKHCLQVYQPRDVAPARTMLLFVTGGRIGGKPGPEQVNLALALAKAVGAPCAFLYQVPNQPLLGDKNEDALIAETFVRYLKTEDEDWLLLFPMVKSVVKAMDALQEFSKETWKAPVEAFVVAGASKRGWTTWLTAASGDPRVKAIAPMVIDTLNMREQLPHQFTAFGGKYSDEIGDYTGRGLTAVADTPAGKHLFELVDPYSYRDKLTLPKMVILGNNDPYWTTDALNLYWDGLKGDKWVVYVPNAGHGLDQRTAGGHDLTRARNGLAAFARHQLAGTPMPRLEWKHDDADGKLRLTVTCKPAPLAARLWAAEAPTLDFRKAEWKERPTALADGTVTGAVAPPKKGCLAFYGEVEYEMDGLRYYLSTQLRVAGTPLPPEK